MEENLLNQFQAKIQKVAQSWDSRDFETAKGEFNDIVEIDYTSLGAPQVTNDTIEQLCQNWKIVLSGFDKTTHTVKVEGYEKVDDIFVVHSKVEAYHFIDQVADGCEWTLKGSYVHKFKLINEQLKIIGMQLTVNEQIGNLKLILEATKRTMQ